MEFKNIFDNHFPRRLRIGYRRTDNNQTINESLVYLLKINKLDAVKFGQKYIEKVKKQAKYIG